MNVLCLAWTNKAMMALGSFGKRLFKTACPANEQSGFEA